MTLEEGRQIVDHLLECSKPVISAVNGYAMGLGATVALLCDVVYAARVGGVRRHPREDGHRRRRRRPGDLAAADGRQPGQVLPDDRRPRLTAAEAERLGLVNFVVDDGTVVDEALALAGAPGRRARPGDLGVEDGRQQLHAHRCRASCCRCR